MENLIKLLNDKNKTIACMESCTGGLLASEITNIKGASNVFKLGLVTYSNEYKEYFGVSKEVITKYTVYSREVACNMAKQITNIAKSDYGVGITGQLGVKDTANNSENINTVYISIYNSLIDSYNNYEIQAEGNNRINKKMYIVNFIKERLYEICK